MLNPIENQKKALELPTAKPLPPEAAGALAGLAFSRQLQTTHLRVGHETMVAFLAEIDEAGRRLAKRPIRGEIARYRALVGKFLKEASRQTNLVDKKLDRRNRAFVLVKQIDQKLDELTEMLISGQDQSLEILARLNEIRGMLVDLLV